MVMPHDSYRSEIETDGFSVCRSVLSDDVIAMMTDGLDRLTAGQATYGLRNLLDRLPPLRNLTNSPPIKALIRPVLGPNAFPVRAIFFNKMVNANWGVPWHQDLTIAVKKKVEVPGYSSWSSKDGTPHVQPPSEILRGMLTLRIHLDAADERNGALIVIPGSHLWGRQTPAQIARRTEQSEACLCKVGAGDVLAMRPLLVHASRSGTMPDRRRVVHVEFASSVLPPGLEWFEARTTGP